MRKRVHGLEMEMAPILFIGNEVQHNDKNKKVLEKFIKDFLLQKYKSYERVILPNQAQVYRDRGQFEIATPECVSIRDLLLHKQVSQAIVVKELRKFNEYLKQTLDPDAYFSILCGSSDILKKHTRGCHENFQMERVFSGYNFSSNSGDKTMKICQDFLSSFLIARKILDGSGFFFKDSRGTVGIKYHLNYCISQRISFIKKLVGGTATDKRPLICKKGDDPLGYRTRLHLTSGEYNCPPVPIFIKMASVSLLVEMLEEGYFADKNPLYFSDFKKEETSSDFIITPYLIKKIDNDLHCREMYLFEDGRRLRLCDVLDIYAEWMLDYLTSGKYYTEAEKDDLYWEKFAAAEKIKEMAECFANGDIFDLEGDIEWIMKLRWMSLELKKKADIEIGTLDDWLNLERILEGKCGNTDNLKEIKEMILYKSSFWSELDYFNSDYGLWNECGLVNPVFIKGEKVDLSHETVDAHLDNVPLNPPNRSLARKKLREFVKDLGLESYFATRWERCYFNEKNYRIPTEEQIDLAVHIQKIFENLSTDRVNALKRILRGTIIQFSDPVQVNYPWVDEFIRQVKRLIQE